MNRSPRIKHLKILQVCSSRSWGGMEMHVPILASKLQQRGHDVVVAAFPKSRIHRASVSYGVSYIPLKVTSYCHPVQIKKIAEWLRFHPVNVVHCHYSKDLWAVVPALKMAGKVPLILVKHIGTQKPKRDILHRFLYKNVDFIIANSNIICQNILNTHPVTPKQVGMIHLGIDMQRFSPNSALRREVRREFGYTDENLVIGIVGRLQVGKGHLEFLKMAEYLGERYSHLRFLIIGGATYGEEAEAAQIRMKVQNSPLQNRIRLTGFRNDIHRLLNALDIFVFPSHAEAFGLVLLEAMATGLPVVSSNCDGVVDIVTNRVEGLLVPPKEVAQLTAAVEELVQSPELRHRLGQKGRQKVKAQFDLEQMVDKIEDLYFTLALSNNR